ncbi:MAG: hypothetical protein DYG94_02510 [Leptolyngbya sp. PLA3]|nr:MAG: hypothetical protein EDM82_02045 [Cyanobacteria bacterium CYA]MCE7967601.1 hypothetical protein [Leptolyngbya sp. PL-A3]
MAAQVVSAAAMLALGSWPRRVRVRWMLLSTVWVAALCRLRLHWLFLRRIAAGRIRRSAGLLFQSASRGVVTICSAVSLVRLVPKVSSTAPASAETLIGLDRLTGSGSVQEADVPN